MLRKRSMSQNGNDDVVAPKRKAKATGPIALVSVGAVACGICCALPFALPAVVLAGSGGALAWIGGGLAAQHQWTRPHGEPVTVALVQANIPQSVKWDPNAFRATLDIYRDLSAPLWRDHDIVFWPEAAIPAWRDAGPQVRAAVCVEIVDQINKRSFELANAVMHTSGQPFVVRRGSSLLQRHGNTGDCFASACGRVRQARARSPRFARIAELYVRYLRHLRPHGCASRSCLARRDDRPDAASRPGRTRRAHRPRGRSGPPAAVDHRC